MPHIALQIHAARKILFNLAMHCLAWLRYAQLRPAVKIILLNFAMLRLALHRQ